MTESLPALQGAPKQRQGVGGVPNEAEMSRLLYDYLLSHWLKPINSMTSATPDFFSHWPACPEKIVTSFQKLKWTLKIAGDCPSISFLRVLKKTRMPLRPRADINWEGTRGNFGKYSISQ